MNKLPDPNDISEFSDVIIDLRHKFNSPCLEDEISHLAPNATVSNRFLIKMEIMNLSRDISRIIDLRTFFSQDCEKYTHKGISHFLDDMGKKDFESELEKYSHKYTLGVYEHVIRKAKLRHKNTPITSHIPETELIHLTRIFQRKEERLYFIKKICLFFNSPEKMTPIAFENFAISGITTDLSENGLAIKVLTENVIRTKGLVHVWIHGIETEYNFSGRVIITYEIKNTFTKNEFTYLNLNYYSQQFCKVTDEFFTYANNYLLTHKKRNNVPVDNTVNAITVKASEQFVITRLNALPVFLSKENGYWLPNAQFKTANNLSIGNFENAKNNHEFLRSFCASPIIQKDLIAGKRFTHYVFIMPIIDKKGNKYYISVPHEKVLHNPFIKKLASVAKQKNQLRLYRIDGNSTSPETQCYVPSSLPSSAGEAFENLNQQPVQVAKSLAKSLQRMIVLTDFTDSIGHFNLVNENDNDNQDPLHLPDFVLTPTTQQIEIFDAKAETNDFRSEDRFLANLNIQLAVNVNSINDAIDCTTINISTRGLKVRIKPAVNLSIGDQLLIRFPDLFSDDNNENDQFQPYYIAGQDSPTDYRLFIKGDGTEHFGRKLIKSYINKNISDLKVVGNENEVYGLSRVLRNIFANNIHVPYGIMAKSGSERYIKDIALSYNTRLPDFTEDNKTELLKLMHTESLRSLISTQIEGISKEQPYEYLYVVIMPRTRSNGDKYFFVKNIDSGDDNQELVSLIGVLRCIGSPRILRITCTKKSRVFNKYFRDEMAYLEKFAARRLKKIDAILRNTFGILEVSDITDLLKTILK